MSARMKRLVLEWLVDVGIVLCGLGVGAVLAWGMARGWW
jgi:hypothetical protein